jgi:hypothetical protein
LKVIFLDVDGVLNSRGKWAGCDLANLTDSGTRIDPLAVARLKRIVDATDAKIVVSSTWRLNHFDDLRIYLWLHDGLRNRVIGATPDHHGQPRGSEIQEWLDSHPGGAVWSFVILDGDADMVHLMPRLVKTDSSTGYAMSSRTGDGDVDVRCS